MEGGVFNINPRVLEKVVKNIENRVSPLVKEDYSAVQAEMRKLEDGQTFGEECLSMREKVAKYLFYQIS